MTRNGGQVQFPRRSSRSLLFPSPQHAQAAKERPHYKALDDPWCERLDLQGTVPADLPFEQPTKYELVIKSQDRQSARIDPATELARPRRQNDRVGVVLYAHVAERARGRNWHTLVFVYHIGGMPRLSIIRCGNSWLISTLVCCSRPCDQGWRRQQKRRVGRYLNRISGYRHRTRLGAPPHFAS